MEFVELVAGLEADNVFPRGFAGSSGEPLSTSQLDRKVLFRSKTPRCSSFIKSRVSANSPKSNSYIPLVMLRRREMALPSSRFLHADSGFS